MVVSHVSHKALNQGGVDVSHLVRHLENLRRTGVL